MSSPQAAIPNLDVLGVEAEMSISPEAPAAEAVELRPAFTRLYDIRRFATGDADACRRLYREGLLGGRIAENDTGVDIDDIPAAYLDDPRNGFWIATISEALGEFTAWLPPGARAGDVVAMIGVQHHEEGVGEIRRLRVHPDHQRRGIGTRLLETAIRFCRESGSLKVQLDSWVQREPALRLFERFRFRHSRTRTINGRELLYFYLDLYHNRADGR